MGVALLLLSRDLLALEAEHPHDGHP
jgi:hypothetical protein